ncbi:hypothetical protein [Kocuria rosea]|uniref:hypothetical protein n=1 Tax=Kocuria rosea TaxID=1275 RepID=UPI003D359264
MTAHEYDQTIDFSTLEAAERGAAHYALRVRDHIQVFRGATMESFAAGEFDADQVKVVSGVLDHLDSVVMRDIVELAGLTIPEGYRVADTIDVTDEEPRP